MNTLVLAFITIIFPLNSFLAFPGLFGAEKKKVDFPVEEVKGVETAKEEVKKNIPEKILPGPAYQPTKKEGVGDFFVPNAHAALILDADSGTILHYQNGKERRQIASLTKMMTAVLVMEKVSDLEELVTIDEDSMYVDGTKIGCPRSGFCNSQRLKLGERISVRNLLKAMLMNSANDAATALGKHVGGSTDEFVGMMNQRAKEMGLSDTNFCTPSGLEIEGKEETCYSSAYDIARIASYALKFPEIWDIFKLPTNTIIKSADGKTEHAILNTDMILDEMPNVLGGKTGFTPLAGYSLLVATQDKTKKHTIISVLLNDPYRWADIKSMTDWAFSSHVWN